MSRSRGSRTEDLSRLSRAELGAGRVQLRLLESDGLAVERPRTRGECIGGERPCPWVGCRHHLFLEVHPRTGNVLYNFGQLEPDELEHSCSLDVADAAADEGGLVLEEVARRLNLTHQGVRAIEVRALVRMRQRGAA